jgi:adenine nucleotide transporter 17
MSVFTVESLADGVSGAAGGISAISVFYPLNIIRTKLQTDDPAKKERSIREVLEEILRDDGVGGLFKGWWGQVIALGCSNFVYFYAYQVLKAKIQRATRARITPGINLAVGAVAGCINVGMTTPLWMVCTQLAVQAKRGTKDGVEPYKGMIDGLSRCFQTEGLAGLWKGLIPNLMLVSNPTIHFFTYERVRYAFERVAQRRGSPITSPEFFFMGALAKAVATVFTYPVQIAQSQLRNDRKSEDGTRKYAGTLDCLRKIYAAAGLAGLYRGIFAKLWQTVLTAAFQFMTFEKLRVVIFRLMTGKELKN